MRRPGSEDPHRRERNLETLLRGEKIFEEVLFPNLFWGRLPFFFEVLFLFGSK